jgi:DHA1 family bicyclomycin/chloramphenicol resistance-like MFS transporter
MVPLGFIIGTVISSHIGNRASVERMILIGASLAVIAVFVQSSLVWSGYVTPLVLFLPSSFMTMGTGSFAAVCAGHPCA